MCKKAVVPMAAVRLPANSVEEQLFKKGVGVATRWLASLLNIFSLERSHFVPRNMHIIKPNNVFIGF